MEKEFKRQLILDNSQNPYHKGTPTENGYVKVNTNNESCIDNLDIYFRIENKKVIDVLFDGEACAISTSATSIMLRNLVGKTFEEIKEIIENYKNMIGEKPYNESVLRDLNVYNEIYLQPNRKNCALLPAKAIEKMIKNFEE